MAGHASSFEFDWFIRTFSREKLPVVSSDRFDASQRSLMRTN